MKQRQTHGICPSTTSTAVYGSCIFFASSVKLRMLSPRPWNMMSRFRSARAAGTYSDFQPWRAGFGRRGGGDTGFRFRGCEASGAGVALIMC